MHEAEKATAWVMNDGRVVLAKMEMSLDEFCMLVGMVAAVLDKVRGKSAYPWFSQPVREQVAVAGIALQSSAGQQAIEAVLARAKQWERREK